jgi:hypothetical protein
LKPLRNFDFPHLLLAIELSIILFFCARPAVDSDYGWHVANGGHVFDGAIFSGRDIYSWTARNAWVAHEWLTEAVMNLVDRVLGPSGNSILFALIGLAAYALLATLLRKRFRWSVVLIAIPVCFAGSLRSIGVRPQMLELLYLCMLLFLIDSYLRGTVARGKLIIACLIGAIAWANTHGSFLLMPAVLGITAVELLLARDSRWRDFLIAGALSAIVSLANPWGSALLGFATQSITSQTTLSGIEEWQRPVLTESLAIPLLLQIALAVTGIAAILMKRASSGETGSRYPATLGILRTLAFAFLAIKSGRHVMLFGIAAAPLIAQGVHILLELSRSAISRSATRGQMTVPGGRDATLINLAAAFLIAVSISWIAWQKTSPAAQRAAMIELYPLQAASALRVTMTTSDRLFNEYRWGGFLIQRKILPVFIDGRSELYGDAQLERYASIIHLDNGWQSHIDELGITLVLMPDDAPLTAALKSSGWITIAGDSAGVLLASPARKENGDA